jgi:hypothetical protein
MGDTVVSVRRAPFLLLVVALAAACGGSKSYASKADTICKKFTKQTSALGRPTDMMELASVADKTLPLLDQAAKQLAALQPPPDKRAEAQQWLAQLGVLRADLGEIRDKAKSGDAAGLATVALKAQQDNAKANDLGRSLGFKVCDKN